MCGQRRDFSKKPITLLIILSIALFYPFAPYFSIFFFDGLTFYRNYLYCILSNIPSIFPRTIEIISFTSSGFQSMV